MCCTFVTYYILETFEKTFKIIGLNQKSVKIYYTHQYKIQTFWTRITAAKNGLFADTPSFSSMADFQGRRKV